MGEADFAAAGPLTSYHFLTFSHFFYLVSLLLLGGVSPASSLIVTVG